MRHSPATLPRVLVDLRQDDVFTKSPDNCTGGGEVRVSVKDDGIGYWDGSPLRRRNAALTTLEAESLRVSGTHDMSQGIAK